MSNVHVDDRSTVFLLAEGITVYDNKSALKLDFVAGSDTITQYCCGEVEKTWTVRDFFRYTQIVHAYAAWLDAINGPEPPVSDRGVSSQDTEKSDAKDKPDHLNYFVGYCPRCGADIHGRDRFLDDSDELQCPGCHKLWHFSDLKHKASPDSDLQSLARDINSHDSVDRFEASLEQARAELSVGQFNQLLSVLARLQWES